MTLQDSIDANLGGKMDNRKSTSGSCFIFGCIAVSWKSRLQKYVSFSTTEVEYVAISKAGKEIIWLENFLKEIGNDQDSSVLLNDNQGATCLAKIQEFHLNKKHFS